MLSKMYTGIVCFAQTDITEKVNQKHWKTGTKMWMAINSQYY